jgi:hypothetical protein
MINFIDRTIKHMQFNPTARSCTSQTVGVKFLSMGSNGSTPIVAVKNKNWPIKAAVESQSVWQ